MQQKIALDILKTGRNVYLTGAAGSGKTHVLNSYISYLRKHNAVVGVTASTGIAATHLNGMTIHSWSGIGVKDYLSEWDLDTMMQRQPLVRRLERTDILIIDEVSMLRPEILDMVDMVARALKRSKDPFGGMQVVLSGDFFQLPPVVRKTTEEIFADTARSWCEADFRVCYLTEQYRQEGGKLLSILNDIRDGEVSAVSRKALQERLLTNGGYAEDPVVLYTHNKDVDERNATELKKIDSDSVVYEMTSGGRANLIESLKKSVLAPEKLELKVGARVMFVKNSSEQEYVNGTLGEVISLEGEYPLIKTKTGHEVVARPVSWETTDDTKVLASVTQVPLRLAWAITVHKSQGMSLDVVEADLSKAFAPGQGYVALSRSRTLNGLVLKGLNPTALQVHPYVRERDEQLQAESRRWENVFQKFSKAKVQQMHEEFVDRVGHAVSQSPGIPTHFKTQALAKRGGSIADMAKERGLTKATVLSHLEKLKDAGEDELLEYLKPNQDELNEIERAFKRSKGDKLSPVHKLLRGKYTYEQLRLARLFL
ncbi:helicase [bacterium]|nr:helicase [bacterium]|tara:strand:- start:14863 stop:16482 length:1620 start_codon:yes stop_codon:yes gene_type:complete